MLSMTCEERRVVLFLSCVALIGAGISALVKYLPPKTVANFTQDIGKVDVNRADIDMLMSVPGIGRTLAERVLAYRLEHGRINDLEELTTIKGITGYRYEKMRDALCVK